MKVELPVAYPIAVVCVTAFRDVAVKCVADYYVCRKYCVLDYYAEICKRILAIEPHADFFFETSAAFNLSHVVGHCVVFLPSRFYGMAVLMKNSLTVARTYRQYCGRKYKDSYYMMLISWHYPAWECLRTCCCSAACRIVFCRCLVRRRFAVSRRLVPVFSSSFSFLYCQTG